MEVLVGDAMAGAREEALEREVEGLRIDLEAALAEAVELAKNPAWETEVPADEWEAMLEEKEACLEGLLDERAAMEEHIASVEGEKAALERRVEALEGGEEGGAGADEHADDLLLGQREPPPRARGGEGGAPAEAGGGERHWHGSWAATALHQWTKPAETGASGEGRRRYGGRGIRRLLLIRCRGEEMPRSCATLRSSSPNWKGSAMKLCRSSGLQRGAATGGGDLVSMAVLEDFREQQMEDRAEWEAEKARLEGGALEAQRSRRCSKRSITRG